jgi:hypothetical protein
MKAVVVDGTVEEIVEFVRRMGAKEAVLVAAPESLQAGDHIARFVSHRVKGNAEKQRLVMAYLAGVDVGDLRVRVAIKENGTENDYVTGRLTTLDEDRVGNVIYCRPSSTLVHFRLPASAAEGSTYAKRVDSQKSAEEFIKVKHQVTLKLVSDDAVAEAVRLTQLAIKLAQDDQW